MPLVNYCGKCATETPVGDACPHCGNRLGKTNERISFGVTLRPVRDWFSWNRLLRVGLPVLGLVLVSALAGEWLLGGEEAVVDLIRRGFAETMLSLLGGLLLIVFLILELQGVEKIHYVLDREGVKAYTYLKDARPLRLYARFLTPAAAERLREDKNALQGLTLVRRTLLPWEALRRVRIWREGPALLFYRPAYWQVLAAVCPVGELAEAEAYIRAKVKRNKKVTVLPREKPVGKKKKRP